MSGLSRRKRFSITELVMMIVLAIIVSSAVTFSTTPDAHAEKIPDWVKGVFNWYAQGNISEDDLIQALQFLIDAGVIDVAPGANLIAKPILEEIAKPELKFHLDEPVYGEKAIQFMESQTEYMQNVSASEADRKISSLDGEYYLFVLPDYQGEWLVEDTNFNTVSGTDAAVFPMNCYGMYSIKAYGLIGMTFVYNDITIDTGETLLMGLCRDQ